MAVEAWIIIAFFVLLGAVVVLSSILTFAYIWWKKHRDEQYLTADFLKLMLTLYEKEREKNEKQDEGGMGF